MFSSQNSQVSSAANYIEECFSTYLYTGNGSTQTITNGIDLSTKGGLVWIKGRSTAVSNNLYDTSRGIGQTLISNTTAAEDYDPNRLSAFNTNGFSVGSAANIINTNGTTYASWTFREQAKFFDVVTYTGNGVAGRTISHNLGAVPACMIIKSTDQTYDWAVYHQSLGNTKNLVLNTTAASATDTDIWNSTTPTSTVFSVGAGAKVNSNGTTYVAYLFAHNAGGFGLTGTDNVISCGSFTSDGSSPVSVNLGYEPQWVLVKASTASGYDWWLFDNMRGTPVGSGPQMLRANASSAENTSSSSAFQPNATGFTADGSWLGASTFIYIAIRRGPMKVPTSGTSVFNPVLGVSTAPAFRSSNFNSGIDSAINFYKPGYSGYARWSSRLTGTGVIPTSGTDAESAVTYNTFDYMNGFYNLAGLDTDFGAWMFKRAPGFHDEVCYTGTGTNRTVTHNLGVAPELMLVKVRSQPDYAWRVYAAPTGNTGFLVLNATDAFTSSGSAWNNTNPTSSVFTLGTAGSVNLPGETLVAYLFATCAGVSKVGSYTGTGTTKQIDCGFAAGARFVLIKRTDSTGDWYVWDTARGIVSGNDPYLLLNSTAAETTGTDYIDTYSAGFEISSTAPAAINASGGTFIFLAIA